ncbi:hypothetical protein Y032_0080g1316 [Ancylostoma ceylanicum]|uniref:BPTI/Kunitz inhibitor domain-containing protein n=1 Tax=Ancylostoma ceylanicum TaxID=53326 RepID=A0A016TTG7_9BILA|nr:hypothetical protein Y032_0080g1316 [Ancylostoma ceylanicum]
MPPLHTCMCQEIAEMKPSLFILFAVIYCCTVATPKNPICLEKLGWDNTAWGCDFSQYYYTYKKESGKCESFRLCTETGRNIFTTKEACEQACIN